MDVVRQALVMRAKYEKTCICVFLLGMFALQPLFSVAELYIATEVSAIGLMKITFAAVPHNTLTSFNNTPEFSSFAIHGSGTSSNAAYVSTLSNKPADYSTMGATLIPAVQILDVTALSVMTAHFLPITSIVHPVSFNAAVSEDSQLFLFKSLFVLSLKRRMGVGMCLKTRAGSYSSALVSLSAP